MKRVSSEKKPCSRPPSERRSPRLSPTTNVLPSSTLSVRLGTNQRRLRCVERHRAVDTLVGRGDDVDVAMRGDPGSAATRGDGGEPADRGGHSLLVGDEVAG